MTIGSSIRLEALGKDDSGVISMAEVAAASKSLATLDKNKDGKLEPQELSSRMVSIIKRSDLDKDGLASRDENQKLIAA